MSPSLKRILHSIFPKRISSVAHAELLIRNSVIFSFAVAGLGVVATFLFRYDIVNIPSFYDGWTNAFIFGPIAYFLFEKEKIVAWAALIYTIADQSYSITNGNFPSVVSVAAMIFFASSLRGIYYLNKSSTTSFAKHVELSNNSSSEKIAS